MGWVSRENGKPARHKGKGELSTTLEATFRLTTAPRARTHNTKRFPGWGCYAPQPNLRQICSEDDMRHHRCFINKHGLRASWRLWKQWFWMRSVSQGRLHKRACNITVFELSLTTDIKHITLNPKQMLLWEPTCATGNNDFKWEGPAKVVWWAEAAAIHVWHRDH